MVIILNYNYLFTHLSTVKETLHCLLMFILSFILINKIPNFNQAYYSSFKRPTLIS